MGSCCTGTTRSKWQVSYSDNRPSQTYDTLAEATATGAAVRKANPTVVPSVRAVPR